MSLEPTPHPEGFGHRANAFVTQAAGLARWATRTGTDLARKLPGAAAVEAELEQLERTALTELRRRLDTVDPLDHGERRGAWAGGWDSEAARPTRDAPPPKQTEPLRVVMAELLQRSLEQSKQRAREYLYLALLRQLVPDEARILSALADGSVYPVVHVEQRTGVSASRRVLSHASTVGRAAGVSVTDSVPRYLSRLLHFDLVEIGAEDLTLTVQYDILTTDQAVRDAEDTARDGGRARFVRRTVRISPLGRDLWDACHPREEVEGNAPVDPVAFMTPTRYAWEQVLQPEPLVPNTVFVPDRPTSGKGHAPPELTAP